MNADDRSGPEDDGAAAGLAALYRESIRRHAAAPAGFRRAIAATHRHEAYNPLCGDRIEIGLRVAGDTIEAAAFDGEGCAICLASASLLCELAPGRAVAALRALGALLHDALAAVGAASAANGEEPGVGAALAANNPESRLKPLPQLELPPELEPLLGVRRYPSRVRCATLAWEAAGAALAGGGEGPAD